MRPGDRVGALLGAKGDRVEFLGYGVYEGDFVPEGAAGWMAEAARELGHENPRIRLDSGKVVWGCECWWGPEEEVRASLTRYPQRVDVDIDEVRRALEDPS